MEQSKGQVALKVGLNTVSSKAVDKAVGGLLLMSLWNPWFSPAKRGSYDVRIAKLNNIGLGHGISMLPG